MRWSWTFTTCRDAARRAGLAIVLAATACALPEYIQGASGKHNNNNNCSSQNNGGDGGSQGNNSGGNPDGGGSGNGNGSNGNGDGGNNGNDDDGGNDNCGGNNNNGNGNENNGNGDGGYTGPPQIFSIQPLQVQPGGSLTISGQGFQAPLSVSTGVGMCAITSSTESQISCTTPSSVPQNDFDTPISLTVQASNGQAGLNWAFEFITPNPAITGFSPSTVRWGDTLTISGTYLDQTDLSVQFQGVGTQVQPQSVSANSLQVQVPQDAQSGPVTLRFASGSVSSTMSLTVLQLAILSLSTSTAGILDPVTASGYGFESGMQVSVGSTMVNLPLSNLSSNSFTFRVPVGATTGAVTVQEGSNSSSTTQTLQISGGTVVATGNDLATSGQQQSSASLTYFAGESDMVISGWLEFTSGPNQGQVGTLDFLLNPTTFYTQESFIPASGQGYILVQ